MLSAKDSQGKSMLIFGLHGLHLLGGGFFLSGGMSDLRTSQVSAAPPSVAALFVQGPEERSPAADGPWPNWPRLVS